MNADRWQRIEALFHQASALPEDDRGAFLRRETTGDDALREEVESLLRVSTEDGDLVLDLVASSADAFRQSQAEEAVGRRVGDYALVRPLGYGGMGTVYLAERADAEFDKLVAVKFARRAFASGPLLRRFRAERQILAKLEHPNIARLIDAGATDDGEPFVVIEYVEGVPIDRYAGDKNLTIRQRLALIVRVCEAVQYAHQNLVVHRDIKPGNILVTANGEPKLLDFGIAKLMETAEDGTAEETSHTARLLTPEYASPEQRRGETVTTATDVYSLGVLLHVLITGQRPSADGTLSMSALKGDLRTIVEKATRPETTGRYGTAQELADDLRRYMDGRPVVARPATFAYRARKFVRRNRTRVAAAIVTLVALVAMTAFYTARLARERDAAEIARAEAEMVSDFMVDLFQYVDPEANRGESITARELLDAAAQRLDTALADQPAVRGRMLRNIGTVYLNIGLREEGERTLRKALLTLESRGVPPDAELASATYFLASATTDDAQRDSLFALTAARADSAGDAGRPAGISARVRMAGLLSDQGRYAESEAMLRRELALLDSFPHPDQDLRSFAEFMLSITLFSRGRLLESLPYIRQSYERRRTTLGPDEPRTLQSLREFVTTLQAVGEWEEGAERGLELASLLKQLYGEDHAQVAYASTIAALGFLQLGRLSEAESLATWAVERRRAVAGNRGTILAVALRILGRVQADAGALEDGVRNGREAVRIMADATDSSWAWISNTALDLAHTLMDAGRYAEAERELTALVAGDVAFFGDTSLFTAMRRASLAALYARTNRPEAADSLLTLAMPTLRERLPAKHARIANTLVTRATVLLARGDAAGAEASSREALGIMQQLAPNYGAWHAEARIPLGLAHARSGRIEEARATLDTALRDLLPVRGPNHAVTRMARAALDGLSS